MKQIYKELDQLPVLFGADELCAVMAISRASAYQLLHRADFPVVTLGRRRLVRKDRFIQWLDKFDYETT